MTDNATVTADRKITGLLQDALGHLNRNETPAAEALLEKVLARKPEEANALQLMGLIREGQGRLEESEALYRRSLSIQPDQPHVHYNLGTLLYPQARFDEALAAFAEAVRLRPNYAEALLQLGHCHQMKGDLAAAEKTFRQALRMQPNFLKAMQSLGGVLTDQNRGAEAERVLRQALAVGSRDPQLVAGLQHNLGVALKQQQRHAEAIQLFDAAQNLAPDMQMADYNRANTLQAMGRLEEAVEGYRRAIARDPLHVQAHQDLNQLLYRMGRDGEFLNSLNEVTALYPETGALPLLKGRLLFNTERYDEAVAPLEIAAKNMPGFAAPHDTLGLVHAKAGRFGEAIRAHERALGAEPENADLLSNFADTLLRTGDMERARDVAQHAMTIMPAHQKAIALWSLALRKLDDVQEEELNDYEDLVRIFDLPPPQGYSDMETFNRDLNAYLDKLHLDSREPLEQTLRKGTQTQENLFGRGHGIVELLRMRIDEAVLAYIAGMKEDEKHLLFRRRSREIRYAGSWSARLFDCGYHTNHVHPRGWISSSYYVTLPDAIADETGKQGWIKFGEPYFDMGFKEPVKRAIQPKVGRLVLFPSYMWHGTVPFRSQQTRTTVAFDVTPR